MDYVNKGNAENDKGDYYDAKIDYGTAIVIDPNCAAAYYKRAKIECNQDCDSVAAIGDFTLAIELDPHDPSIYEDRGLARQQNRDLNGAITDYSQALKLNPNLRSAYMERAEAKTQKNDVGDAIADFGSAIKIGPDDFLTFQERGIANQLEGNADGAIADFTKAIELYPRDFEAFYHRGYILFISRRFRDALADFRQCDTLSRGEDKDYPHFFIWLTRAQLGEVEAATTELATYMDERGQSAPDNLDTQTAYFIASKMAWSSKVANFLLGKIAYADFLSAADSSDAGQKTDVWFYAGMKHLVAGENAAAADYFGKCVATNQTALADYLRVGLPVDQSRDENTLFEHDLAAVELRSLAKSATPVQEPPVGIASHSSVAAEYPATRPFIPAGAVEAAHLLAMAKLFVNNGELDLAREKLQAIISEYPGDPAASAARKLLDQIGDQ